MDPATWLPELLPRGETTGLAAMLAPPSFGVAATEACGTLSRAFAPGSPFTAMGEREVEGVIEVKRAGLVETPLLPLLLLAGCESRPRTPESAVTGEEGAPIFDTAKDGRATVRVRPSAARFSRRDPRSRTAEPSLNATWRMSPRDTLATWSRPTPLLMMVLLLPET